MEKGKKPYELSRLEIFELKSADVIRTSNDDEMFESSSPEGGWV